MRSQDKTLQGKTPWPSNHEGNARRIGIEIEIGNLSPQRVAEIVQQYFPGDIEPKHRDHITLQTQHGAFEIELDMSFMQQLGEAAADSPEANSFSHIAQEMLSPLASTVIPVEIVTPPLHIEDINTLDAMLPVLREAGAEGTKAALLYAFGLQLNPDLPNKDAATLLAFMQAFGLLYDWLKEDIQRDTLRTITMFSQGYPDAYVDYIMQPDYAPPLDKLIDDYLYYNPSRNRALDMLPAFGWLDEARVKNIVKDELLKTRPTFHYRLPNCDLENPDWSITLEWNRWVLVEKLAHNNALREEIAAAYRKHREDFFEEWHTAWAKKLQVYIKKLRT